MIQSHGCFAAFVALVLFLPTTAAYGGKDEKRVPRPYRAIAGGAVSLSHTDSSYQSGAEKSETVGTDVFEIDTHVLFNMGTFYAGPLLGFSTESGGKGEYKYTSDTIDFGVMADKPFGEFACDKMVPHAYGGVRYVSSKERGEKEGATGYRIGVGGGGYYMLRRNVAFDPSFEYQYASLSFGGASKVTKTVTRVAVHFSLVVFL